MTSDTERKAVTENVLEPEEEVTPLIVVLLVSHAAFRAALVPERLVVTIWRGRRGAVGDE